MLTHEGIWAAVDRLAEKRGMSPSALARCAGLDATAFNKSKRTSKNGKPRWPSTESIAKVLEATETPLEDFVAMMNGRDTEIMPSRLKCLNLGRAIRTDHFDDNGDPAGEDWDEVAFPGKGDPRAFALEIPDNGLSPVLREGEIVIVSPDSQPRRGDRVALCFNDGRVIVCDFVRRTVRKITVRSPLHEQNEVDYARSEVRWLYRVDWTLY